MDDMLNKIIITMENYLEVVEKDCSYNKKSIRKFKAISHEYLKKARKCKDQEEFEKVSIIYIEKLNNLNEECDFGLIETDQRELIVSMIDEVAKEKNFNYENDFTEIYREW